MSLRRDEGTQWDVSALASTVAVFPLQELRPQAGAMVGCLPVLGEFGSVWYPLNTKQDESAHKGQPWRQSGSFPLPALALVLLRTINHLFSCPLFHSTTSTSTISMTTERCYAKDGHISPCCGVLSLQCTNLSLQVTSISCLTWRCSQVNSGSGIILQNLNILKTLVGVSISGSAISDTI